jgi:hypothetical protein
MPDKKAKLKIHCPNRKCREINLVWRADYKNKKQIAFKWAVLQY